MMIFVWMEITPIVAARMAELCAQVLAEIERAGGSYQPVAETAAGGSAAAS